MRSAQLALFGSCAAAAAAAPRCNGTANTLPINTAAPAFVRAVPNGKLYVAGTGTDTFYVTHFFGTPYEQGFAHGSLFKGEIAIGLAAFYDWVGGQIEEVVPWLPPAWAEAIAEYGAPIVLELSWNVTAPFTPQKYADEMRGIADGAGVAPMQIYGINSVAEIIRAQCSIIGANGNATRKSLNGSLVHLRTLDGMGGAGMPIKDYAGVFVYHPSDGSPAVANFAWVTFVGSVTGFSETVTVGEKFWNDASQFDQWAGEGWTFVNRDLLSAASLDDALAHLSAANRTCAVNLGLGDTVSSAFRGVQVAAGAYNVYDWETWPQSPSHPVIQDLFYVDKDSQPSDNFCFADLFQDPEIYGSLSLDTLAHIVAPMAQTGDLHAALFDAANKVAYFSNAQKSYATDGGLNAYERQFTRLDMAALFAEKQ